MIRLPRRSTHSNMVHLFDLLEGTYLTQAGPDIHVEFKDIVFYDMASMVGLISKLFCWKKNICQETAGIYAYNIEQAKPFQYMQRMDFFKLCGIELEERFVRHKAHNQFVEISKITRETSTADLSTQIADCLAPDQKDEVEPELSGFYDSLEYSVSELINNVKQHSLGDGFIGAQYYPSSDVVQIAIADNGIGIKQSFIDTNSPYSNRATSDQAAIELALQPKVSSKMHGAYALGGAVNAGVGLSLLNKLAQLVNGDFIVISGYSCYHNSQWFNLSHPYQGTFVCFNVQKKALHNFNALLEQAKVESLDINYGDANEDFLSIFK